MKPLSLVERKRLQARERIVRAAEELFEERGFDAVSVTDIAERADVGRTSFFRHFGDKQEVVFAQEQALMASIEAAHITDAQRAPRDTADAVEQLRDVVLALCEQAVTDPVAYRRHFAFVEQHPELRARDALKMQAFADRLGALLAGRGCDRAVAVLAGQVALACYQTARRTGNDPASLVADTRAAFERVLALRR